MGRNWGRDQSRSRRWRRTGSRNWNGSKEDPEEEIEDDDNNKIKDS